MQPIGNQTRGVTQKLLLRNEDFVQSLPWLLRILKCGSWSWVVLGYRVFGWKVRTTHSSSYIAQLKCICIQQRILLLMFIDKIPCTGRHLGYIQFGFFFLTTSYLGDHLSLIHLSGSLQIDTVVGNHVNAYEKNFYWSESIIILISNRWKMAFILFFALTVQLVI